MAESDEIENISDYKQDHVPIILNGRYFKIESRQGISVPAKCLMSLPAINKLVTGNTTSNVVTHMKRVCKNSVTKYKVHKVKCI